MSLPRDIADLRARFRWIADGRLDSWHFLSGSGALEGDCDDFAVTALRVEAGSLWRFWWWVVTFRAVFWLCRDAAGGNHICLRLRGRGWIDNQFPAWSPEVRHRLRWPVLPPVVAAKLALGVFR